MLFNSGEFIIFFPIVVLIYFALPSKVKKFGCLYPAIIFICAGMQNMHCLYPFFRSWLQGRLNDQKTC